MGNPKKIAEPHKELRFTRAGQAQGFYVAGAIVIALALFIIITWLLGHPSLRWWMSVPPMLTGTFLIRCAIHCTQHAYLILSPLGLEVFPLWKPEKNMMLMYWSEISEAEILDEKQILKLHRDEKQTSGVILSLKPIQKTQQKLLEQAIKGRLAESA